MGMRSPKRPDDTNFQFDGLAAECLGEPCLPWELRPLKQQSPKLQEQKAKLFLVAHRVGRVTGTTFFLTLPAWTGESWLWDKQRHVLDADLERPGDDAPNPKASSPGWHPNQVSERLFHNSIDPSLSGERGMC